jgi:hypothetical protein
MPWLSPSNATSAFMFCPLSKAEYRAGITKCHDCDVNLVSNLPAEELAGDRGVPRNSEGLELLWSGVSQALSDRIHDALDAAHISHKVTKMDFGLLPNLAQSAKFVWIESRDRASSRSVLDKTVDGSGAMERESELTPPDVGRMNPFGLGREVSRRPDRRDAPFESASPFESDAPGEPVPDDIVEDFDPDDATSGVWSGEDAEMAENIRMCLREVGIGSDVKEEDGKSRVLVMPRAEARAREIIREVIEATPPG